MGWEPEEFMLAFSTGPRTVAGYTYRGLGLDMTLRPSKKGKRPAEWRLSHLGSGFFIASLRGDVRAAFSVATEIAEAGDWDFISLVGWRDRFPDVRERLAEVCAKHPKVVIKSVSNGVAHTHEDAFEMARQVAMSRP